VSTLDKKFKIALVVFSAPYNTSVLSDVVLDGERGSVTFALKVITKIYKIVW